jgi:hypothetical protein
MEAGEDCCVKVAVHVRPLINDEKLQGCKDCVTVVSGKPQVHFYYHLQQWNFTFHFCIAFFFVMVEILIGESRKDLDPKLLA